MLPLSQLSVMETLTKSIVLQAAHQERNSDLTSTPERAIRTSSAGIKLIPQPSTDPQDPLVCRDPTIKLTKLPLK